MTETARRVLVCCVLLLSAALYLPLNPEIDTSMVEWHLHPARAENWQYGTEVLTNYGPLGFVGVPFYHPSTWVPSLGINLLVLLLTVVYLTGYWRALRDDPWPSWLWLFFVLVPAGLAPTREWAPVQALPYMIVLASVFRQFFSSRPAGPIAQCALGVLLAIFLMMKLMFLSIIGLGLMVVTADEVFRRRRFPWTLASLFAAGICIWLLMGQSLWNVPPFIRGALEITRGYREVMPLWDAGSTGLAVLLMLAFLCTGAALYFRARRDLGRWRAWVPTLVWLGTGYLVVLHAFVRPDPWHIVPGLLLLPSLAAMVHPLLAAPEAGGGSASWRFSRAAA